MPTVFKTLKSASVLVFLDVCFVGYISTYDQVCLAYHMTTRRTILWCTSGGVYVPCIYTHARWELPKANLVFGVVLVFWALISSLVCWFPMVSVTTSKCLCGRYKNREVLMLILWAENEYLTSYPLISFFSEYMKQILSLK